MAYLDWLNLQLFGGEGAAGGEGGGDGAEAGASADDAGQQRLLELGVPADKIRKNRSYKVPSAPAPKAVDTADEDTSEGDNGQDDSAGDKGTARLTWDEIMADPEYNKQMQAVVQARLRNSKTAEENLGKMAPVIELMARRYGMDVENMDYDALAKAVNDDDAFYEDKALEMGVSVETAKSIDRNERETARLQREQQRTLEEQRIQDHLAKLEAQGAALKQTFPNFDLRTELQNPAFARMTSPGVGISVEDAYYAVHRKEIQTAAMQVTAQKAAQKISNSIQSGQRRPSEAGTTGQAPSVTTFDYSKASKEQREALKKQIRDAAARGEKLYPGR